MNHQWKKQRRLLEIMLINENEPTKHQWPAIQNGKIESKHQKESFQVLTVVKRRLLLIHQTFQNVIDRIMPKNMCKMCHLKFIRIWCVGKMKNGKSDQIASFLSVMWKKSAELNYWKNCKKEIGIPVLYTRNTMMEFLISIKKKVIFEIGKKNMKISEWKVR